MSWVVRLGPFLFVLLWSSAFVGAKYGLPYAEPLTFMWLRLLLVTGAFLLIGLVLRAPWPRDMRTAGHIGFVGFLVQGLYLSGTFVSLDRGASAGMVSLVLGMQPVLTLGLVSLLSWSRVPLTQCAGVLLGLVGLVLVVHDKLGLGEINAANLSPVGIGLVCITAGTLYQRRFCTGMNLVTGNAIQAAVATVTTGLGALAFETMEIDWNPHFIGALAWQVLVVSLGAHTLLLFMLRNDQALKVSSLFYLTPPTVAVMAFFIFDEMFTAAALLGFTVSVTGVALVVRGFARRDAKLEL